MLGGRALGITCCALSPDGGQALSGSWDTTLRLWDIDTGHEMRRFQGHNEKVIFSASSADGHRSISASRDGKVCVWEVGTGRCLAVYYAGAPLEAFAATSDLRNVIAEDQVLELHSLGLGHVA